MLAQLFYCAEKKVLKATKIVVVVLPDHQYNQNHIAAMTESNVIHSQTIRKKTAATDTAERINVFQQ